MPKPCHLRTIAALVAIMVAPAPPVGAEPAGTGGARCRGLAAPVVAGAPAVAPLWRWVVGRTGLPEEAPPPAVRAVSERCLLAFRHGSFQRAAIFEIEAAYAPAGATIYLRRGWRGESPAARSILVHELVHHAQHLGGSRFACPAEAEKQAYRLQEAWLAQHGLDLERAIGLDPLARLVLTECTM